MEEALQYVIKQTGGAKPELGVILGSGWGFYAREGLTDAAAVPYDDIPGFPRATAPGHAGRLWFASRGGRNIAFMQGRFHCYEGWSMPQVVMPARLLARLGAQTLILTNAAGGINPDLDPASLMLITDHINFMGANPLTGPNDDSLGPRFPDMSRVYDPDLIAFTEDAARKLNLPIRKGVYLAVSGPSFETPAEIRAFRAWGADAAGMSTVPEAIAARHAGMRVLGLSCISNKAAGMTETPLTAEDVARTAEHARPVMGRLLDYLILNLPLQAQ